MQTSTLTSTATAIATATAPLTHATAMRSIRALWGAWLTPDELATLNDQDAPTLQMVAAVALRHATGATVAAFETVN